MTSSLIQNTASTPAASTVRDVTLDLMRSLGMTTIFGNPGSTELPMYRDFPDDFRYVLALQESVVLGVADGYALATGNAAFINLHSAAGLGHALGNLFTSYRNQTPLVVTAGQQSRSILPYEPFLFAERATEFPRPYVKWSCEPARAEDVPAAIARAYYVAMQPPYGPTFVSIPVDDWDRPCPPLATRDVHARYAGDPAVLAEAARAMAAAKKPTIVVNGGVARDGAWDGVITLAERHQAPVWVAPLCGRNNFPEDHPLFAGFLPGDRAAIVARLGETDFILTLGGPLSTYHVDGEGPHIPEGAHMIQLVNDPVAASWAPVGTSIVTDTAVGVAALLAGPEPAARSAPPRRPAPPALDMGGAFTDAHLMERLAALRPAGSVIVEEAPGSRGAMQARLPIIDRDTFYTGASGGLGYGLPAAVGMAMGRPGEKIIALIGDGSSSYSIQALWTAAQQKLPISFVIVKNRRYEALHHFGRHFGLDRTVGTELPDIDFCALARGYGVESFAAGSLEDIDGALLASFAAKGPTLVEVSVA
ncbi:thiamine pyrophosphate enzyme TPP binding domain protein (plasmid) [Rhizorhabdus wittichii RW1]|uniref:Thiamine pyrophosphate enzyme TPP binding domain protein n=1 Tax=Rhizorhabdus wittichii (strain DSM 6014 / CCUG 31198 / JCM 15750 / NBRC 105917 / EY 4224 / RW1) TaxID=392499 RepID=A0A9J9LH03_RHIWR|nr:benzoylformate decarboxylase [Sphingobium sp. LB126]ABQ71660.1 thiamine pyrophosphate enzyme TPP binding domain protein [Rhizorhabdus wittichii RW1]PJG45537.1 benzoylformate decarboxylase [Sphingobium sp. LB126]